MTCEGVLDNEGDEFFDASAEPSSPTFLSRAASRGSGRLPFADPDTESVTSRASSFKDAPGPSELWRSQDQGRCIRLCLVSKGPIKVTKHCMLNHHVHCCKACKASSLLRVGAGGEPAEAPTPKKNSAWVLEFDTWAQTSSGYAGVDSEMRMRLKTLYFYANRPTIGALMGIGGDLAAAFRSGQPQVFPTYCKVSPSWRHSCILCTPVLKIYSCCLSLLGVGLDRLHHQRPLSLQTHRLQRQLDLGLAPICRLQHQVPVVMSTEEMLKAQMTWTLMRPQP